MENKSNFTSDYDSYWIKTTAALEFVNIALLAIVLWILICMVVYGTKTGRWRRRPRTSRLNNGTIYVSCTLCVMMFLLQMTANHVIYFLPRIEDGLKKWCETVCNVANGAYMAAYCASYCFLWFRQRLIFTNPYVKDKLPGWLDWFSRVVVLVLIGGWTAVACVTLIQPGYDSDSYACIEADEKEQTHEIQTEMILVVSTTILMSILSLYPAMAVKFDATQDGSDPGNVTEVASEVTKSHFELFSTFCQNMLKTALGKGISVSPIHLSVRRTVLSTFIMGISEVLAVIFAELVLPGRIPLTVLWIIYNVNSVIFVFSMIITFGFASNVLFLPCKLLPRSKSSPNVARNRGMPVASV